MIGIKILKKVLKKSCKTVSVRRLHTIIINNSKKISFNIYLKNFQGVCVRSGLTRQVIPKRGSCLIKTSIIRCFCLIIMAFSDCCNLDG